MHLQMALANEVPLADVHEVILFAAADAGHSTVLGALKRFKELCGEWNLDYPKGGDARCVQRSIGVAVPKVSQIGIGRRFMQKSATFVDNSIRSTVTTRPRG